MCTDVIAVYFDVYGCQMNVSDAEVAWGILQEKGFSRTNNIQQVSSLQLPVADIRLPQLWIPYSYCSLWPDTSTTT